MAFANAFLGICHSMAHKLGAAWHVPHGLANAVLISHVIRYNATDAPFKQAAFPQYEHPEVCGREGGDQELQAGRHSSAHQPQDSKPRLHG
jgi:acetaldehyde dehydrogenase/alcohol dehydrogenase